MRPPRPATWLLERALPADVREDVTGDLIEVWRGKREAGGRVRADAWFWGQVLSFSARFLKERWTARESSVSTLDLKLALRMLVKYPGLSIVGGVALTVAFAIGAAWFEFGSDYAPAALPIPYGDRVVGIVERDLEAAELDRHVLHDFVAWKRELKSVEELGAFWNLERNLRTPDGRSELVRGVEVSASAFRLAQVRPLLGRTLLEADESPTAPPVVVIGYDVWQDRFAGSPDVIGTDVQLGEAHATVVGVMPASFTFPVNFRLWVPLRLDPLAYERGAGPSLAVFGRLAPGRSMAEAQAELSAIGARAAADHPETNGRLRPEVASFVWSIVGRVGMANPVTLGNLGFLLALFVVCANVATLIFARTATRASEIVVRSALGASRRRIVTQLFVEALALALASATVGLLLVSCFIGRGMDLFWAVQGGLALRPFWFDTALSRTTVLYALIMAVGAAVIVGVVPALKITSGEMASRLRQAAAGGSGMRFGGVWTAIIVVQVAITVAFLPLAFDEGLQVIMLQRSAPSFARDELLYARVFLDEEGTALAGSATYSARFAGLQAELRRRLAAEPGVVGVSFANGLPSSAGEGITLQVEGVGAAVGSVERGRIASVDADFLATLGAHLTRGRDFEATDLAGDRRAAIVNESFARRAFGRTEPIGRRLRSTTTSGVEGEATYEVVGVVEDLGGVIDAGADPAKLYRLVGGGTIERPWLAVRTTGAPTTFAPRLREITREVSPALRLYQVESLASMGEAEKQSYYYILLAMAAVGSVALLLSTVGVHSLMSFAVSQRTREIGIRVALGAEPGRIVRAIFSRAALQVGTGVVVGMTIVMLSANRDTLGRSVLVVTSVGALMTVIGLVAGVVPARRALRIQPTEALRGE